MARDDVRGDYSYRLRQGELMALRWDEVDLVAGRVIVRRSGHRYLRGEFVFCHEAGRAWRENELRSAAVPACQLAGICRIGWHVLGHTFASHLVMRGVALKAVQEHRGISPSR